ncbi:MAG TPA: DHHA1 domain-containing protein [Terriglobia bacterium]|nr:DHHA1 domain-containing protein [Terriglobia bacterium]
MSQTDRLYYTDCYLKEFSARVVRTNPDPRGTRVFLDRTAFYPGSGGQPSDRGTLAGIPVLDVIDEGDDVAHILPNTPAEEAVQGSIDWERRFDHMQQHTGQHILSAAFERVGGYKTVSFHLGTESATIDLDSDRVGAKQIEEAEKLANGVVFENRAVRVSFRSAAEVQQLDLRKPTFREGDIRLVEVVGFDHSACGGTHVTGTGSVGIISIRKVERARGLTRVEFVCGGRALRRSRQDFAILSEAARLFSTGFESVPELITKQSQDVRDAGKSVQKLEEELAQLEAAQWWQQAPERAGVRVVRCVFASTEGKKAKLIAHALGKRAGAIALIGVKGAPTALFFSQSRGGRTNLSDVMKQTLAKLGGKGGGTRDFAQGGGLPEDELEAALSFAESLLS